MIICLNDIELVLENLDTNYEIICINDGSQDNTLQHLKEHNQRNPKIKVVNFSRNFGKEIALSAGLDYSRGAQQLFLLMLTCKILQS